MAENEKHARLVFRATRRSASRFSCGRDVDLRGTVLRMPTPCCDDCGQTLVVTTTRRSTLSLRHDVLGFRCLECGRLWCESCADSRMPTWPSGSFFENPPRCSREDTCGHCVVTNVNGMRPEMHCAPRMFTSRRKPRPFTPVVWRIDEKTWQTNDCRVGSANRESRTRQTVYHTAPAMRSLSSRASADSRFGPSEKSYSSRSQFSLTPLR